MMRVCHFSRNDRTALCGVSVADMCTDFYTDDSLDAVTCEPCREILYPEPAVVGLWCVCQFTRGWNQDELVRCPGCGKQVCPDCYSLHRYECSNI